jgi:iron complex outermembrane receptor protein
VPATPEPTPAPTPAPEVTPAPAPAPNVASTPDLDAQLLADSEAEAAEGEAIMVTGSRIGADPLDKQAPVLQLGREALDRTGLVSVGDVLQQLPMSGGAINSKFNSSGNFGAPPDGGGIGAGAIEADLRYLGSKRVLVLVDGVRWVNGSSASGVAAATDLNTIPLGIIERVEVLQDGASPIYGSDAIAGVINIITRKRFDGVSASAYMGGFHKGDGFTQKYDVTWGNNTDKMSMVLSASYLDQHSVFSKDREISDSPIPGLDNCEAGCSSATPQGRVKFKDPVLCAAFENGICDFTLNNGVDKPTTADYHTFGTADRFNFAPYNLMMTPSQRLGLFTGITYRLPKKINFRGKASFTNRKSVNQAGPEPLFLGPDGGNGNRVDRIGIDATNPDRKSVV